MHLAVLDPAVGYTRTEILIVTVLMFSASSPHPTTRAAIGSSWYPARHRAGGHQRSNVARADRTPLGTTSHTAYRANHP